MIFTQDFSLFLVSKRSSNFFSTILLVISLGLAKDLPFYFCLREFSSGCPENTLDEQLRKDFS